MTREVIGYQGEATGARVAANQVLRSVIGRDDARFGIGQRKTRVLTVESDAGTIASNVFQLSSGESSLLNLFLTMLRDADLSGASVSSMEELRGIVLVDEIDLHLHVVHQRRVLPTLMRMFPKIQFVVTTHSPLFVLGMNSEFGDDGFALYRLPEGAQIDAEEFSEFDGAYQALMDTRRAQADVREAIESSQRPIIFAEGPTDVRYLKTAAELLKRQDLLEEVVLRFGGSASRLDTIWKAHANVMKNAVPSKIVLLYDSDARGKQGSGQPADEGNVSRRFMPMQDGHPIRTGIENLFSRETLQRARDAAPELFVITPEHPKLVGSEETIVPEAWALPSNTEKQALCDLLCRSGDKGDFGAFEDVFQMIADVVG